MLKSYTFWLSAAVLFQLLTAAIHCISFFVEPDLNNETERQIHTLITTYREDLGAGFAPTFSELFTALSACFPLLCLLGALTMGYLMFKHVEPGLMKGIIAINLGVFGVCLLVMLSLTFLLPITMTALIVFNLVLAYIFCPQSASSV
ncbi:MAG: hypothetical protein ABJA02_07180 [Acidobacteriota bacterium]